MSEEAQAVETTVEQTEVIEDVKVESSTTETQPEATGEPEESKKEELPAGVKKRFGELTRDKYQLKEQLTKKDELIAQLQSQNQPQEPVEPNYDDFDSTEEFVAATKKYANDVANFESEKRVKAAADENRATQSRNERIQYQGDYLKKVEDQKELFEDFDGNINDPVVASIMNQYDKDIVDIIWRSEKGPALSYHLATHLDDAEKIASMTPMQASYELARIESRIELPKPKTVSNAPTPIKSANGKTSLDKKPEDMSQEDHDKWRANRKASRR